MSNSLEYLPVWQLCMELYGYRPTPQTIRRWALGLNNDGKHLPCIKAGGSYRTTREALISYMTVEPVGKESVELPKSRSERAKQKSAEDATNRLSASGV